MRGDRKRGWPGALVAAALSSAAACVAASLAFGAAGRITAIPPVAATSAAAPAASSIGPPARPAAAAFAGTPAVGVLAPASGGAITGRHFCTASVVHSAGKNLIITAAHCVSGYLGDPSGLAFVPGYRNGAAPFGVWTVTQIMVDPAWASSADADDDVAFLAVRPAGGTAAIEDVTGAEELGIGWPPGEVVRVIGYPDSQDTPIICQNRASAFTAQQMRFDCASFSTGTSGGPFLAGTGARTGHGTVIGVIGGYQQGGATADTSYSVTFDEDVRALYNTAAAQS